jgi:hypothetical protein
MMSISKLVSLGHYRHASHERVEAVAACAANRCEDSIYTWRFRAEIMLVVRSLPRYAFKRTST